MRAYTGEEAGKPIVIAEPEREIAGQFNQLAEIIAGHIKE